MNKATTKKLERELRARRVYRPYVSISSVSEMTVESYPLTVYVTVGFDDYDGPLHSLKLTDCSLPRIGQDSTITTCRVLCGQDLVQRIAELLKDYHQPAYDRASAQDRAALETA